MFKNLWNLLEATFFTITNMILLISSIEDHAVGTCMIMLFFLKPMLEYYFLPGQFYDQGMSLTVDYAISYDKNLLVFL